MCTRAEQLRRAHPQHGERVSEESDGSEGEPSRGELARGRPRRRLLSSLSTPRAALDQALTPLLAGPCRLRSISDPRRCRPHSPAQTHLAPPRRAPFPPGSSSACFGRFAQAPEQVRVMPASGRRLPRPMLTAGRAPACSVLPPSLSPTPPLAGGYLRSYIRNRTE